MKQFACGTLMEGCPGVVSGETEEEVLSAAAAHAAEAHGLTDLTDDIITAVKAGITET
ncbi:MAG: DUF1059 domain-containing protein [Acidimicrobiales bacterium]